MSPNTTREGQECDCGTCAYETSRCHKSNKMTDCDWSKIVELIQCSFCKKFFNDSNHLPKDLHCKHSFCLECIQSGFSKANAQKGSAVRSGELYCDLCWKLTELSEKGPNALETNASKLALVALYMKLNGESSKVTNGGEVTNAPDPQSSENPENAVELCTAHGSPLGLWCINCETPICKDCQKSVHSEPLNHKIWTLQQAKEQMIKEAYLELSCMTRMDDNVRQLARRQRQFLILIRDACTALMREIQSSLDSDWNIDPTVEIREALTQIQLALMGAKSPREVHHLFSVLLHKKQNLQAKCREMITQCQLNDLIGHSEIIFDFDALQKAVAGILSNEKESKPIPLQQPLQDPILFLTNYCMSQLFSRLHQRPNDSFLLNPSLQRQLVMSPQDIPSIPRPPAIPTPPQNLVLTPPQNFAPTIPHSFTSITPQNFDHKLPQNFSPTPNKNFSLHEPTEIFTNPIDITLPPKADFTPPNLEPVESSLSPIDQVITPCGSATHTPPQVNSPPVSQATNSVQVATAARIVQMQTVVSLDRAAEPPSPIIHPPVRPVPTRSPANVAPRYFFNIEISGVTKGKIVIETRPDVTPKMCRNFDRLTTADRRMSYKGCNFFQCWKNESVITGDYECNTGRGGRSIYEDGYFQPDDARLPAVRGAVGMRRQQKKHDHFGLVGSQFRIILQDMQGFTGIFGQVVEGIELIEHIASFGDHTGKPIKTITIAKCGKL